MLMEDWERSVKEREETRAWEQLHRPLGLGGTAPAASPRRPSIYKTGVTPGSARGEGAGYEAHVISTGLDHGIDGSGFVLGDGRRASAILGGTSASKNGMHELYDAVVAGNARAVSQLLKEHPEHASQKDPSGDTILHLAALNGRLQVAELIVGTVQGRAAVMMKGGLNKTPSEIAKAWQRREWQA